MAKEFINPNWHVILIHYPLGVFMLGLLLEVAFLIFRYQGAVRIAARWMIVLGALLLSQVIAMIDLEPLPGDILYDQGGWQIHIPVLYSLGASVVLALVIGWLRR